MLRGRVLENCIGPAGLRCAALRLDMVVDSPVYDS